VTLLAESDLLPADQVQIGLGPQPFGKSQGALDIAHPGQRSDHPQIGLMVDAAHLRGHRPQGD